MTPELLARLLLAYQRSHDDLIVQYWLLQKENERLRFALTFTWLRMMGENGDYAS